MKRKGFTIAESLITMVIIGIVAALTIPTFVASQRKHAYATILASTVSTLEKTFVVSMMKQNANNFYDTDLLEENNAGSFIRKLNIISNNINISDDNQVVTLTLKNGAVVTFMNITNRDNSARNEEEVLSEGGSLFSIVGMVQIDVNGAKSPNDTGKDQFVAYIGCDGKLYSMNGRDFAIYSNDEPVDPKVECVDNDNLEYCGAYLFENGFKMDY